MRRSLAVSALVIVLLGHALFPSIATSGPYTDELSKCLVEATTDEDRVVFVQWMFAILALHPNVKQYSAISDSQRTELNQRMGVLLERLLTVDCLAETRQALRYEGQGTIEASFNVFGQVAARELMSHPDVAAGFAELSESGNQKELERLLQTPSQE